MSWVRPFVARSCALSNAWCGTGRSARQTLHNVGAAEADCEALSSAAVEAYQQVSRLPEGIRADELPVDVVQNLYRRGLLFIDVPVKSTDYISIPPLEVRHGPNSIEVKMLLQLAIRSLDGTLAGVHQQQGLDGRSGRSCRSKDATSSIK